MLMARQYSDLLDKLPSHDLEVLDIEPHDGLSAPHGFSDVTTTGIDGVVVLGNERAPRAAFSLVGSDVVVVVMDDLTVHLLVGAQPVLALLIRAVQTVYTEGPVVRGHRCAIVVGGDVLEHKLQHVKLLFDVGILGFPRIVLM
jgi:hypothetical protein